MLTHINESQRLYQPRFEFKYNQIFTKTSIHQNPSINPIQNMQNQRNQSGRLNLAEMLEIYNRIKEKILFKRSIEDA